jgi:predicted heme/steroid binding protein
MREYTVEEVSKANGQNGHPALVVYDGRVYDVSKSDLWMDGDHQGHNAGRDLTVDMNEAPHDEEVLMRFPQVGVLKK